MFYLGNLYIGRNITIQLKISGLLSIQCLEYTSTNTNHFSRWFFYDSCTQIKNVWYNSGMLNKETK